MKMKFKRVAMLGSLVLAMTAMATANAAAASFEASSPGNLKGQATQATTFSATGGGQFKCSKAAISGTASQLVSQSLKVTYQYSGCGFLGFHTVSSPAEFVFHANGDVDLLKSFTLDVVGAGCKLTVLPGNGFRSNSYQNNAGKVTVKSSISGLSYASTGGICGPSGKLMIQGNADVGLEGGTLTYNP